MPEVPLKIMMNVGNPERAFSFAQIPNHGVGLARLEFVINNMVGIHPKALLEFDKLKPDLQKQISGRVAAYRYPRDYFVKRVAEGISTIAAAFQPAPVILRMSDFKSNEYANLIGGDLYEPEEENPMIGFRGVSRYISESFRECFEMECEAIRYVRDTMGLSNLQVMIPFVRTLEEAAKVTELLAANGLERGKDGLKVIMMCELPSNAVMAEEFLAYFGGVPGLFRRFLDRLQRHDPAHPGTGPRLRAGGAQFRRAQPGGEEDAGHGDPGGAQGRQVHRYLRPGPVRSPGPGGMTAGAGDRECFTEPGHGGRYLALPGRQGGLRCCA